MIRGIHHVAVVVQDLERMLDFYIGVVGCEQAAQIGWEQGTTLVDEIIGVPDSAADVRILRLGNAYLELFAYTAPVNPGVDPANSAAEHGIRHFALDVTDIDAEYDRLTAAGATFMAPPQLVEVQGNPVKAAYFRDPEGNILELQELVDGAASPMAVPGL
jgi:catechol 2,3-dioxygenase-like lactoylglutathione lyase family enzyme